MGVPPAEEEMLMATVCPSGAPEVVPEMVTDPTSAALRNPSPPSLMATEMVGAAVSLVVESVAWVAELPEVGYIGCDGEGAVGEGREIEASDGVGVCVDGGGGVDGCAAS